MLILLNGLIGSGKDTVANYLVKNYNFVKVSYGGALKDVLSSAFGWPRSLLEGVSEESRQWRETIDPWWSHRLNIPDLTPRKMMQQWGTDLIRKQFHMEMWVASCELQIQRLLDSGHHVVISDYRFPNEYNVAKLTPESVAIRVRRNDPDWVDAYLRGRLHELYPDVHESEWKTLECYVDVSIDNSGSKEQLYKIVDRIVQDKLMK